MSNSNSNSNTIRGSSISAYAYSLGGVLGIICILRSSVPCPLSLSHTLSLSLSLSFFSLGFFSPFPRIIDLS